MRFLEAGSRESEESGSREPLGMSLGQGLGGAGRSQKNEGSLDFSIKIWLRGLGG